MLQWHSQGEMGISPKQQELLLEKLLFSWLYKVTNFLENRIKMVKHKIAIEIYLSETKRFPKIPMLIDF